MRKKYLLIASTAIQYNNKFLVIQHPESKSAAGILAFPGGKVEQQDESNDLDILRNAAKREVLEEVGIDLKTELQYITSAFFQGVDNIPIIDTIFHSILEEEPLIVISPREIQCYFWMTADEIMQSEKATWIKDQVKLIV